MFESCMIGRVLVVSRLSNLYTRVADSWNGSPSVRALKYPHLAFDLEVSNMSTPQPSSEAAFLIKWHKAICGAVCAGNL